MRYRIAPSQRDHCCFFFSSRRRHTRSLCDWSSDVCSSDLAFYGSWTSKEGELFTGSFTVQCKFSQKPSRSLTLAALADERSEERRVGKECGSRKWRYE